MLVGLLLFVALPIFPGGNTPMQYVLGQIFKQPVGIGAKYP